jgi:hypothetical protein
VNIHKTKNQKPKTKNKESIANAIPKKVFGEFENVMLTNEKHEKLVKNFGEGRANELIEKLSRYMALNRQTLQRPPCNPAYLGKQAPRTSTC